MIADLLAEFRRRIDVSQAQVPDATLTHFLDVAEAGIEPWIIDDPTPYASNVEEATLQVAVKMWDVAARGVTSLSPSGDYTLPAASATPGLVRSAFPALGPALYMGGLSV
jgi:hypothetical protein